MGISYSPYPEGLGFYTIGNSLYKPGSLAEAFKQLAQLSEIEALQYSVASCRQTAEIICQDALLHQSQQLP